MKTDLELQQDVEDELTWEPSVTSSVIGVSVSKGTVTLTGMVPTYAEKHAAEQAVRRVNGVKSVAVEIQVRPAGLHKRSDTEIAEAVAQALRAHVWVPTDVQATVEDGWVRLTGDVLWDFQRAAALDAVRYLAGVKGVTNDIAIAPSVEPTEVKEDIVSALKRTALSDADHVRVRTDGGKVFLSGAVRSWAERDAAEQAAWSAPGVSMVQDDIVVTC